MLVTALLVQFLLSFTSTFANITESSNTTVTTTEIPTTTTPHTVLFGLIKQTCPKEPIPELGDIKECSKDSDCTPRICCPEGDNFYCRTPQPLWEELSPKVFVEPIKGAISYVQCTPPPPKIWDLSPKPCETPLDCFPNLCCQEGGKRHCRPPKKSIITLIAEIGQRIVPNDVAKEFIKRIS